MPIINRAADLVGEITLWRRDLHENPELGYDVDRTAGIVAEKLRAFGRGSARPASSASFTGENAHRAGCSGSELTWTHSRLRRLPACPTPRR
jgi:metal-dependent amidase/aminoacylase/carboxypeptidase family protein